MKKQVSAFVATLIISASVPGAALASQRLCSAVTPGNWRDTIEAPPEWTPVGCSNFTKWQSATQAQIGCTTTTGVSFGEPFSPGQARLTDKNFPADNSCNWRND